MLPLRIASILTSACAVLGHRALSSRALAAAQHVASEVMADGRLVGIIPADALTHFCVVTGYDQFNQTLATCESSGPRTTDIPCSLGLP